MTRTQYRRIDLQYWADKLMQPTPLDPISWKERQQIVIAFHQIGAHDFAAMARRFIPTHDKDGATMVDCSLGHTMH